MNPNEVAIGVAVDELQQEMDVFIEIDPEGNRTIVDWRDLAPMALEDTIKSENLAVGQVIMVHVRLMTAIFLFLYGKAIGSQEWIDAGIQAFEAVFGINAERNAEYVRVVEIPQDETDEMDVERIDRQEIVDKLVEQAKNMAFTVENFRRLYEDLSIFAKMFGGFSIDCAKKSGVFFIPYAEKTQKALDVRIKNLDDKLFGVKRMKKDVKLDTDYWQVLPETNGITFAISKIEARPIWASGEFNEKLMLNDPVSQCMDISLQQARDLLKFYAEQPTPVFSEAMREEILKRIRDRKTFFIALLAAKYMTELWLTLNSWKQEKIKIVIGRNQGRPCKEEIAAVKSQATPGFKRIKEENIRTIFHVFRNLTAKNEMNPDFMAAIAIAACFTNKKNEWEEQDYTVSAMTMATEYVNLFFYRRMKAQGCAGPETVVEPLDLLVNIEKGQVLDFIDGEAENHDTEEEAVAVAVDDSVQGSWEVDEDDKGRPFIKRSVESLLLEALPTGDETVRVFASVADDKQKMNTLGKALDIAQATGQDVVLAYAANAGKNCGPKVGNAIVINNEIVGQYRTPYVDKKSYKEADQRFAEVAYQSLVTAVGGIKGKIERFYNYRSREKDTWCTVCVLRDVSRITDNKGLYPNGIVNRMEEDVRGSKDAARRQVQESLKGIQIVSI